MAGSAVRRRQRMLRSMWRHEQMAIKLALAEKLHHSANRTVLPKKEEVEQDYALRGQKQARAGPGTQFLFVGGVSVPEPAGEPQLQARVQRHTMEQRIEHTPYVQILDAPVPQKVEQLVDFFKDLDSHVPVQVIEVPKISQDIIPQRSVDLVPQMAEQLVEVPTVLTPTRIAVQIAEHIVGIPVPHGFGGKRRLQGLLPEQSSTATYSSLERISERTVEQIVDFPSSGGGLGLGSSLSTGLPGSANQGVFRTFPRGKKCGVRSRPESHGARQCQLMDSGGL